MYLWVTRTGQFAFTAYIQLGGGGGGGGLTESEKPNGQGG